MMTTDGFAKLAQRIAELNGLTIERASQYLARIGDTPDVAEDGRVSVKDTTGAEIALIIFPVEESSPA
jgi:hypothetical protein